MATTIVFDLITQLVATFSEAITEDIATVWDGPLITRDDGNYLAVNTDPEFEGPVKAASGSQEWAGLGAHAAYEDGTIPCCAAAWVGDSDEGAQQRMREAVRDIHKAAEAVLRADPNLGGTVPGLTWVQPGANFDGPHQIADELGTLCVFYFDVAYKARLV